MPTIERTEQIKILREDYVSVSIYRNTVGCKVYYDVVPSRLISVKRPDGTKRRQWSRSANYKPIDLPVLIRLLAQAVRLLDDFDALGSLTPETLELIKLAE